MPEDTELVEALAEYAHDAWSRWMKYQGRVFYSVHPSGELCQERWGRLMNCSYKELSEEEKESDRAEARKILEVFQRLMGESKQK